MLNLLYWLTQLFQKTEAQIGPSVISHPIFYSIVLLVLTFSGLRGVITGKARLAGFVGGVFFLFLSSAIALSLFHHQAEVVPIIQGEVSKLLGAEEPIID